MGVTERRGRVRPGSIPGYLFEVFTLVKLTATYKDQNFKRSTDRTYTHVIIIKEEGTAWKAVSWAGSFDLAQKRISEFTRANREIKIIPVDTGD
jgi:hypothetical protein